MTKVNMLQCEVIVSAVLAFQLTKHQDQPPQQIISNATILLP